jgi:NMD protein affecting ribosome stability and mRNA decay
MAMWNMKINKCKKCGKKSESIIQGIVHLRMDHKINVDYDKKKYLEYLEILWSD